MATLNGSLNTLFPEFHLGALISEYDKMSAADRACVPERIVSKLEAARGHFLKMDILNTHTSASMVSDGVSCTEPLVKFYMMVFACTAHLAKAEELAAEKAEEKGGFSFL